MKLDAALLLGREWALALPLLDRLEQPILARAFLGELVWQDLRVDADDIAAIPQTEMSRPLDDGGRGLSQYRCRPCYRLGACYGPKYMGHAFFLLTVQVRL
jgi:hypothetical protein